MAPASALFRSLPFLGHKPGGCHRALQGRRIRVSAYYSLDCSSITASSTSSFSRCGCPAFGLPTVPSFLGSSGSWQLQNSSSSLIHRLNLCGWRTKKALRNSGTVTKAGMRLDPGSGGGGGNGIGRVIVNLALAGGLTYLTVTGKLGWVFDTIISLWLLAVLLPIVGVIAFLWFAEREIVTVS